MHPNQQLTGPAGCAREVERWLSAKPCRGFEIPVLVFMRRDFYRLSELNVSYDIELHRGKHFMSESIDSLTRIAKVLRLPRIFSKMAKELDGAPNATVPLGHIAYRIDGKCAITDEVFPKIASGNPRRFGTYAELACAHNLEKVGIAKSFLTPTRSSKMRRAQIRDCNLKINKETPAMDWKLGLSLRLRKHSQAVRAERAGKKLVRVL